MVTVTTTPAYKEARMRGSINRSDLTPDEILLLGYYQSKPFCDESNEATALVVGISQQSVVDCRRSLIEKGLIVVRHIVVAL